MWGVLLRDGLDVGVFDSSHVNSRGWLCGGSVVLVRESETLISCDPPL